MGFCNNGYSCCGKGKVNKAVVIDIALLLLQRAKWAQTPDTAHQNAKEVQASVKIKKK